MARSAFHHRQHHYLLWFWLLPAAVLAVAFAGIEPFSTYKDLAVKSVVSIVSTAQSSNADKPSPADPTAKKAATSLIPAGTYAVEGAATSLTLNSDGTYETSGGLGRTGGPILESGVGFYEADGGYLNLTNSASKHTYSIACKYNTESHTVSLNFNVGPTDDWVTFYRQ